MSRRRNEAWVVPLALLTLIEGRSASAGSTGSASPHTHQGSGASKAPSDTSDFPPMLVRLSANQPPTARKSLIISGHESCFPASA